MNAACYEKGRLMSAIQERLRSLNIQLPSVSGPFGAYVPVKRVGPLLYVSGQLPMKDGKPLAIGQVPSRASIEHAKAAARQCIINALGAVAAVDGLLDQVISVIRVGVFVSSDSTFTQQPQVANGASEVLLEIFGEPGKHVRAAVGVNTLPLDASVEVEVIFELQPHLQ
jgi:enamine deaminase RidA (YjgF/YER057c/UK114 family)